MRRDTRYVRVLAAALTGLVFLVSGVVQAEDGSMTGKVAAAAVKVAETAKKAGVCVEVSLSAVENAMAAQDQTEADLMNAMKAGSKARITASEKRLALATEEAEEARELAKKIIDLAAECHAAAAAAGEDAGKITLETTDRDAAAFMKRMDHLVEITRNALKKAEALAETLKKKWLLPVITLTSTTTSTTTTTTTTQPPKLATTTPPPTPTPVGRR